jgi:hypothetical protein
MGSNDPDDSYNKQPLKLNLINKIVILTKDIQIKGILIMLLDIINGTVAVNICFIYHAGLIF